jgi:DNA modification methylase
MKKVSEPELRVPYTQQFSPEQTPLKRLLPLLRTNARKGKSTKLRNAIGSAFFKSKTDPNKLAGNTLIALKGYGIISDTNEPTDFGKELLALQGRDAEAHSLLASRILFEFNGITIVETLKEMASANLPINLTTLPEELRHRGLQVSKNSSDLSGVLNWLRAAGVLKDYAVDQDTYKALAGAGAATMDAAKGLTSEQIAFLRAMVALNVSDWTPYDAIVRHAEALYSGEIRYNWKDIPAIYLKGLADAGLIEFRKRAKKDKKTPEGRGGKAADVRPTDLFNKQFADPLLTALYRSAGFRQIREIRSKSLDEIVADIKQKKDVNKSGKALEMLAIRLCQLLDLDFAGWRETDVEVAAGGEVDAMLHAARLIYSRWQVQCKVGPISLEAVAKEVGMQGITLANVILLVGSGKITASAHTFRQKKISTSNLNIIFIDGADLEKIIKDNSAVLKILRKQAQDALNLKPKVTGLKSNPPSESGAGGSESGSEVEESSGPVQARPSRDLAPAYTTGRGQMYCGDALEVLPWLIEKGFRAKLIHTSPPFALVRKKEYGNEDSDTYLQWFEQFIPHFKQILEPGGSLVIDIGGSWIKGLPVKSVYHFKVLVKLCESDFYLAQDFYHYNPARLPTPAEWVTVRRLRVKDATNNVWWLTLDPFVDADNRRVLSPYSDSMKSLLKNGYKPGLRPSGHNISDKFQRDNGGAIPPNLLQMPTADDLPDDVLPFSNTDSQGHYLRRCKEENIKPHPARFPHALPEFFINFLTKPGDLILDPFAGSNVTGAAAQRLGRQWISIELDSDYVRASQFRFEPGATMEHELSQESGPQAETLPLFSTELVH